MIPRGGDCMDRVTILKDVSDYGLEKLRELQEQGILRVVEPNATILTWLTPDDLKTVVEDALESYGIEASSEQIDELIDDTCELWERCDCGISYDEMYDIASDVVYEHYKDKIKD